MESKHTPGPWTSSQIGDVVYGPSHRHPQSTELGVEIESKPVVCFVRGYRGSEEAEANARLIAAAPELLEACAAALPALVEGREFQGEILEVAAQVREAIAKAEIS